MEDPFGWRGDILSPSEKQVMLSYPRGTESSWL